MRLQPLVRRGLLACAMFFLLWLAWQTLSGAFRQLSRSRTLGQKVETVTQLECGTPEFAGRAHLLPGTQMGSAGPYSLEHLSRSRSWTLRSGLGSSHAAHSGTLRCDLSAPGASRPIGLAYVLLAFTLLAASILKFVSRLPNTRNSQDSKACHSTTT